MVPCSTCFIHIIKHLSPVTLPRVKMFPTTFSVIALTAALIAISFNGGQTSYISDYSEEYPDMMLGKSTGIRDDIRSYISDSVHHDWGYWAEWAYCDAYEYALVARLQVEPTQSYKLDDSSVNNIELSCGNRRDYNFIRSGDAEYGVWGNIGGCAPPQHIVGFTLKVDPYAGSCNKTGYEGCDDTSTTSLRLTCGTWVNDKLVHETTSHLSGHPWGEWQKEQRCPPHTYVCGIRAQIDSDGKTNEFAHLGDRDRTGLNGVSMACCGWN